MSATERGLWIVTGTKRCPLMLFGGAQSTESKMSNDTKEWANIRIEEPVRDNARDDPRTYTEIMRDGMKADKQADPDVDVGAFDEELARRIVEQLPEHKLSVDGVQEQLDRIESAASTAEARTGSIENTLENAGLGR